MAPGRWSSSYSSLGSTSTTCAPSPMSRWTSLRLMACGIGTSPADSTRPADSRRSVLYARRRHTSTALHPAATDYAALDRCGRCRQDLPGQRHGQTRDGGIGLQQPASLVRDRSRCVGNFCLASSPGSALEDVLREQSGHHVVRYIDYVADPQIDGHAADDVGLLPGEASLLEQRDHVEEGAPAGRVEVLALIDALLVDRHPHGGDESLGRRPARVDEVVAPLESRPADLAALGLAPMHAEAHDTGHTHFHGGDAHLPVALGEVAVTRREERAIDGHGQQELRAFAELLHVEVAAVLTRRQRSKPVHG